MLKNATFIEPVVSDRSGEESWIAAIAICPVLHSRHNFTRYCSESDFDPQQPFVISSDCSFISDSGGMLRIMKYHSWAHKVEEKIKSNDEV